MLQFPTILFLISFATFAALDVLILHMGLAERFPFLSMPVHLFGGVIFALFLFTLRDIQLLPKEYVSMVTVCSFALLCSALWVGFEWWAQFPVFQSRIIDTLVDVCIGGVGGLIGFYIGKRLRDLR